VTITPIGRTTAMTATSVPAANATATPTTGTSGTSGTTGTTGTSGTGTTSPTANPAMLDRDAFLKLLVAQLRFQDPNKPMDSAEMVSQSASLSVVDKLDQISEVLATSGTTNRLSLGSSIIGKQITFADPDGKTQTAIASSISFDGSSMVVRAGTFDVPADAIRSVAAAPVQAAAPVEAAAAS
jgi:flagellar basal-body rod modification protein FlgD